MITAPHCVFVNTSFSFTSFLSSDLHSSQRPAVSWFPALSHCFCPPSAASFSSILLFHLPLEANCGVWLWSQSCTSRGKWQWGRRFICWDYLFIIRDTGVVSEAYCIHYLCLVKMTGMLLKNTIITENVCTATKGPSAHEWSENQPNKNRFRVFRVPRVRNILH